MEHVENMSEFACTPSLPIEGERRVLCNGHNNIFLSLMKKWDIFSVYRIMVVCSTYSSNKNTSILFDKTAQFLKVILETN